MSTPQENVMKKVSEKKIRLIRLWFTDVLGRMKSMGVTPQQLENVLVEGQGFDGSSIEGFARIEESDMVAMPDPTTFKVLPWSGEERREAVMCCDILNPDGSPYEGDTRYVLKRALDRARELGYIYKTGPELEYFYFRNSNAAETLDRGGYFDITPLDLGSEVRGKTVLTLQDMGIEVECDHHEVAASQHEIDLLYDEALRMADKAMLYRYVVKEVAYQNDLFATFMPKPIEGINGSGMHTHQSLFDRKGGNAFFDAAEEYHLSEVGRRFTAGILHHAKEIVAITNQWVNSYKRLVPGYEAPVYISWARRNRSSMVRVPMYKPGKEKATRIELRSPDPACNPYLAFAVMLQAGLAGIEKGYELPPPVEEDIFHMSPGEQKRRGIEQLPGNLFAAILEVERSDLVREAVGEHIFHKFVENKKIEWDLYRIHVSLYEVEKYLPIL